MENVKDNIIENFQVEHIALGIVCALLRLTEIQPEAFMQKCGDVEQQWAREQAVDAMVRQAAGK